MAVAGTEASRGNARGGRIAEVSADVDLIVAEYRGRQRKGRAQIGLVVVLCRRALVAGRDLEQPMGVREKAGN